MNNPNYQEGGGRLKAAWGRVRTDGLAATVVGVAAALAGLGLEEASAASAATATLSGSFAGIGVLFGIIAVVRLRRRLNREERDRQNREVQKLKEAALGPEESQLASFEKIVKEQGKNNDRTAKKYFWLGILVSGATAVLIDVFAHFIPTVKLSKTSCRQEQGSIRKLIYGAGMAFGSWRKGSAKDRLELQSPKVTVSPKIKITELMAELLPEYPSWYNIGSSISHSIYLGLRDINHSRPAEPLALTPNMLEIGAAVVFATCRLSPDSRPLRCGRMNSDDPTTHVRRGQRRPTILSLAYGSA